MTLPIWLTRSVPPISLRDGTTLTSSSGTGQGRAKPFYQRYAGDPDYELVSFTYMRSRDEGDTQYINGLYARYYLLNGEFQLDVYGEGPLAAGYDGNGPLYTHYEDQLNRLIAGQFTGLDTFREVLSGQIWIGANPPDPNSVPEPGSATLIAVGMAGLARVGWRRRLRTR